MVCGALIMLAVIGAFALGSRAHAALSRDRSPMSELLPTAPRPLVPVEGTGLHDGSADHGLGADPLKDLAQDMDAVVRDLAHEQTGRDVQAKQIAIVEKLDKLIALLDEAMKKACSGGAGSSRNPTKPLQDSVIRGGPGGVGELLAPGTSRKDWGNLPPKEREKILNSRTDGFPAGYEAILESYYRRLAEEQAGEERRGGERTNERNSPGSKP